LVDDAKKMQIECRISSLLEYFAEMQVFFCKDTTFFRKMQILGGICLAGPLENA